uniref:Uncharacterized protein n=1 Tax=Anguilla anguilla TaxID=7936 RepID=A0A0E9SJM5_ANGAN
MERGRSPRHTHEWLFVSSFSAMNSCTVSRIRESKHCGQRALRE